MVFTLNWKGYSFRKTIEARRRRYEMATLSDRVRALNISPIRRVASLLTQTNRKTDIISFGGGAPSLAPPVEVSAEITRRIKENAQVSCAYTGTRGFMELRQLIAEDWRKREGASYE